MLARIAVQDRIRFHHAELLANAEDILLAAGEQVPVRHVRIAGIRHHHACIARHDGRRVMLRIHGDGDEAQTPTEEGLQISTQTGDFPVGVRAGLLAVRVEEVQDHGPVLHQIGEEPDFSPEMIGERDVVEVLGKVSAHHAPVVTRRHGAGGCVGARLVLVGQSQAQQPRREAQAVEEP